MHTNDILILYFKKEAFHLAAGRLIVRRNFEINLIALRFTRHSLFLPLEKQFFIKLAKVRLIT